MDCRLVYNINLVKKIKFSKKLFAVIFITALLIISAIIIAILLPLNEKSILIIRTVFSPNEQLISQYIDKYKDTNTSTNLDLEILTEETHKEIEFKNETETDSEYLENANYKINGKKGDIKETYYKFNINWLGLRLQRSFLKTREILDEVNEKNVTGTKDRIEIKAAIELKFNEMISNAQNNTMLSLNEYFNEPGEFYIEDKRRLENISVKEFIFEESIQDYNGTLIAGKIKLELKNCNREIYENLVYDYKEKIWKFDNLEKLFERFCIPQFIIQGDKYIGTCTDCVYYPANKTYGMRSDYTPVIKQLDLQTDVYVNEKAYEDLRQMYLDAQSSGHAIIINSAYRSYENQQTTFENWVQIEMRAGRDRATAETIANTYSARPGFSEHQLGTAIDIATTQCASFGHGCGPNENLWKWLFDNAYKYGFALSYPKNKEGLTGYVYEPWHYRWIGEELATEFKELETTTTLQQFLFNKNLY